MTKKEWWLHIGLPILIVAVLFGVFLWLAATHPTASNFIPVHRS